MSIGQDINATIRDITCYSKAYLPLFSEELVTADSDSIQAAMTSNDKVRVFRKRNWLLRSLFIGFEPLTTPINKGFIQKMCVKTPTLRMLVGDMYSTSFPAYCYAEHASVIV